MTKINKLSKPMLYAAVYIINYVRTYVFIYIKFIYQKFNFSVPAMMAK